MAHDARPAAYRPQPEGPSPRWQRAAAGLRLVRVAMLAQLALSSLASVVRGYGNGQLVGDGASLSQAQTSFMAAAVLQWGVAVCSVLVAAGLWTFAQAPPSTQVPRVARKVFWLQVASLAFSVLSYAMFRLLASTLATNATRYGLVSVALGLVGVALNGAWLVMFVRALDHARQAAGSTLPEWAPALVAATIAWRVAGLLGGTFSMLLARLSLAAHMAQLGVSLAVSVCLTLALVRLVRLAEHAFARQLAPASEVG